MWRDFESGIQGDWQKHAATRGNFNINRICTNMKVVDSLVTAFCVQLPCTDTPQLGSAMQEDIAFLPIFELFLHWLSGLVQFQEIPTRPLDRHF